MDLRTWHLQLRSSLHVGWCVVGWKMRVIGEKTNTVTWTTEFPRKILETAIFGLRKSGSLKPRHRTSVFLSPREQLRSKCRECEAGPGFYTDVHTWLHWRQSLPEINNQKEMAKGHIRENGGGGRVAKLLWIRWLFQVEFGRIGWRAKLLAPI